MSKLTYILEDQLADARRDAGRKIIRRLQNGLRTEMVSQNGNVYLTLTRNGQYPSLSEWRTVLKHFPYFVPEIDPNREQTGGRFTIFAKLPGEQTLKLF